MIVFIINRRLIQTLGNHSGLANEAIKYPKNDGIEK
jgi:hypothetical protein